MFNLYDYSARRISKCPNYAHSFCERFQMMEANFKAVSINDLLGGPRDRNSSPHCRHHNNISVWTAFEITNVAIMRQDLRPKLQIRRRFEDRHLRRVHADGIDFVHLREDADGML